MSLFIRRGKDIKVYLDIATTWTKKMVSNPFVLSWTGFKLQDRFSLRMIFYVKDLEEGEKSNKKVSVNLNLWADVEREETKG